jgi:hypothetical protein
MLVLKRASKSRLSGEWSDIDYDVWDGNQHIGRIMCIVCGFFGPRIDGTIDRRKS